jgi:hypothetical protein
MKVFIGTSSIAEWQASAILRPHMRANYGQQALKDRAGLGPAFDQTADDGQRLGLRSLAGLWILMRLLAAVGLAWDVKLASEAKIARRLADQQVSPEALDLEDG